MTSFPIELAARSVEIVRHAASAQDLFRSLSDALTGHAVIWWVEAGSIRQHFASRSRPIAEDSALAALTRTAQNSPGPQLLRVDGPRTEVREHSVDGEHWFVGIEGEEAVTHALHEIVFQGIQQLRERARSQHDQDLIHAFINDSNATLFILDREGWVRWQNPATAAETERLIGHADGVNIRQVMSPGERFTALPTIKPGEASSLRRPVKSEHGTVFVTVLFSCLRVGDEDLILVHAVTDSATPVETSEQSAFRIVVHDHDAKLCASIERSLSRAGYQVRSAASAAEAAQICLNWSAHLVLIDPDAPDFSQRILHELGRHGTMPLVVGGRVRGFGHLPKPFAAEDLYEAVRRNLSRTMPADA